MKFKIGQTYSRSEIHDILGGGNISYLPSKNKVITCICVNKTLNPNAPDTILSGTGKQIESKAKWLCEQGDALPTFIKMKVKEWEYVGKYSVASHSCKTKDIKPHATKIKRSDITRIVKLKK